MPIVKYACPPDKPTYGEAHTGAYCVTECKHQCMSPPLMAALIASNQRNHHKGKYLSATALSGCFRKLQLERTKEYAEYYKNMYYAYRGTVMHQVVEDAASVDLGNGVTLDDYGFKSEWRMQIGYCFKHTAFNIPTTVDPADEETWSQVECPQCCDEKIAIEDQDWILLGGTLDTMGPVWEEFDEETGVLPCKLYDLKTMQEYAVRYFVMGDVKNEFHPQVKDDYVRQANVYKYLAEHSFPPEVLRKKGVKQIKIVESHIQGFAMGEAPWTGGGTYRWKSHYRHLPKDWPMYPVTLWENDQIEEYISSNAKEIYNTLILNKKMAPVCEPTADKTGHHSWLCRFCAFVGSVYCPNPEIEWNALQEGVEPREAYDRAKADPFIPPVEEIGELTKKDTAAADKFFKTEEPEPESSDEVIPTSTAVQEENVQTLPKRLTKKWLKEASITTIETALTELYAEINGGNRSTTLTSRVERLHDALKEKKGW